VGLGPVSFDPTFNRPPLPITAQFDPVVPRPSDVVFARITGPSGIRDLDWDIVRYHYVWKVNGGVVRDVVAVGMADAVPRNTAASGDILECTITPNDGHVDGSPLTLSVTVGGAGNGAEHSQRAGRRHPGKYRQAGNDP
jgi:hypothetical protein